MKSASVFLHKKPGCSFVTAIFMLISALQSVNGSAQTPVYRKGVTLAGDSSQYTANNFAGLQQILNTNAGVIGFNLPWYQATTDCSDSSCLTLKPTNPRDWNDPQYANSPVVQTLDAISNYIAVHGHSAFIMGITFGTPGWAACPAERTDSAFYPPQNAADYGDFMYAMSERYSGHHTSNSGVAIGFIRDWVVDNEVNSPSWWRNSACNTNHYGPVFFYGASVNQAYTNVHHLPSSSGVRVLAGAFTSYDRSDYLGNPGLRISTSYSDWKANTDNGNPNHAWISPLDFVSDLKYWNVQFDAIALHPYSPRIYDDPLLQPPAGAVSLGNLSSMLSLQQSLWPNDQSKWHLCLSEYHQHSYYGNEALGWDHMSALACPDYFCAQTTEANLYSYLQTAYSTGGSEKSYVDYLVWTMWSNAYPFVGGLVRADGSDKNEGLGTNSVRSAFAGIQP
jgi:hypothetical protein